MTRQIKLVVYSIFMLVIGVAGGIFWQGRHQEPAPPPIKMQSAGSPKAITYSRNTSFVQLSQDKSLDGQVKEIQKTIDDFIEDNPQYKIITVFQSSHGEHGLYIVFDCRCEISRN